MVGLGGLKAPVLDLPPRPLPIRPHPWTGVLSDAFFALAEVGRVLRRRPRGGHLCDVDAQWAANLETMLYNLRVVGEESITDYGDARTPKADLIAAAKAVRLAGMLEIYRACPAVFWSRFKDGDSEINSTADPSKYTDELDFRLAQLAVRALDLTKPIHISSGACRLLPLLLLMTASQLRLPDAEDAEPAQDDVVVESRYLVEQRMLVISRKYPQRPILSALDTIKEVWERADSGLPGAHWLEVAHDKCWQTMLG